MKYNPDHHHRRSIRLPEYDYATVGAYYVTLGTYGRESLFGKICRGQMWLSDAGRMVRDCWNDLPLHFSHVKLDESVIMPNHFHGIIVICRGTACRAPTVKSNSKSRKEQFGKPIVGSLPTIIRSFKSAVTRRVNIRHNTQGNKLWQRNYYEHVIRDEKDLKKIRRYITVNPRLWKYDEENPDGHYLMR